MGLPLFMMIAGAAMFLMAFGYILGKQLDKQEQMSRQLEAIYRELRLANKEKHDREEWLSAVSTNGTDLRL